MRDSGIPHASVNKPPMRNPRAAQWSSAVLRTAPGFSAAGWTLTTSEDENFRGSGAGKFMELH
jgi:hypothetical protein